MNHIREMPAGETRKVVGTWLHDLEDDLSNNRFDQASRKFRADGYWRDLLAMTGRLCTHHGVADIARGFKRACETNTLTDIRLQYEPSVGVLADIGETVDAIFRFQTDTALGRGVVRLMRDASDGQLRALTLLTSMHELKTVPERMEPERYRETMRVPTAGMKNWLDRRRDAERFADHDPEVVIVGAGHAGLMLAARLGRLKVKTLVIERNARIGDNWRKRYHTLTLHNEICTNHFPYLPFPDTWPVYLPKDKLANWFEFYVESLELNVWTSTTFVGGSYDSADQRWSVEVQTADGTTRIMRPSHLVLATGVSGKPNIPQFKGMDDFTGRIVHSSSAMDDLDVAGKSVVVVGSGTSAHDIAQDFYLRNANVTMVQRSSCTVVSLEPASVRAYEAYRRNEGLRPIEDTDLLTASLPFDLVRLLHVFISGKMAEDDKDLLDALRGVGFLLDNGEDNTGFFLKLLRSLGGYYINVGASNLIIEKKIALKSGVGVERLDQTNVILSDGTALPADIVVVATGYLPLQDTVRSMLGDDIADRVGPIWGIGPDGEMRNMFASTRQPGFFVVGGPFTMCRIYSRYTAFLIRSALERRLAVHESRARPEIDQALSGR